MPPTRQAPADPWRDAVPPEDRRLPWIEALGARVLVSSLRTSASSANPVGVYMAPRWLGGMVGVLWLPLLLLPMFELAVVATLIPSVTPDFAIQAVSAMVILAISPLKVAVVAVVAWIMVRSCIQRVRDGAAADLLLTRVTGRETAYGIALPIIRRLTGISLVYTAAWFVIYLGFVVAVRLGFHAGSGLVHEELMIQFASLALAAIQLYWFVAMRMVITFVTVRLLCGGMMVPGEIALRGRAASDVALPMIIFLVLSLVLPFMIIPVYLFYFGMSELQAVKQLAWLGDQRHDWVDVRGEFPVPVPMRWPEAKNLERRAAHPVLGRRE